MDIRIIISLVLLVVGILSLIAVFRKMFKSNGPMKTVFGIIGFLLVGYGILSVLGQLEVIDYGEDAGKFFLSASTSVPVRTITCPQGFVNQGGQCVASGGNGNGGSGSGTVTTYQPTGEYSTVDKYASTTSISGTSYYKRGDNAATTTAATNLDVGEKISYWVDNSTYWVVPIMDKTAGTGVTPFQTVGYVNGSATLTVYDAIARKTATAGENNVSLGANDQANIEITYQGPAKQSAGPFGGLMVLQYNNTITSSLCTGDDLYTSDIPNFHLTYTTSVTTNTFKTWTYKSSLDDGSGSVNTIACQLRTGSSGAGVGSALTVDFIPADYYVSQSGDILLDTEKWADSSTTRTGTAKNKPTVTAYFAA